MKTDAHMHSSFLMMQRSVQRKMIEDFHPEGFKKPSALQIIMTKMTISGARRADFLM